MDVSQQSLNVSPEIPPIATEIPCMGVQEEPARTLCGALSCHMGYDRAYWILSVVIPSRGGPICTLVCTTNVARLMRKIHVIGSTLGPRGARDKRENLLKSGCATFTEFD